MTRVAVYQDYVQNNGSLLMGLQDLGVPFTLVDAEDIRCGGLDGQAVFIMPGGADLYFCEKLNGEGNGAIRRFVEAGGCYIGICAGAYYACSRLDWGRGNISGRRELAFIDCTATGPISDFIQDGDIEKSWFGSVALKTEDTSFQTLYAAGPQFENLEQGVEILARYDGYGPAVIRKAIGRGSAILSSPHIEVMADHFAAGRYRHLSPHADHEKKIASMLLPHLDRQRAFFKTVLIKAGVELD